jgi:hypothetical protein
MTKLSLLAVTLGTGLVFAAIPTSIKLSPANLTSLSLLSLDTAEARVGRPLSPVSVAGVNRRANRRGYYGGYHGGYYGTRVGLAAGVVAADAVAATVPAGAPGFVSDAVEIEPGLSATVVDPATGRRCTISTSGYHWCWRP